LYVAINHNSLISSSSHNTKVVDSNLTPPVSAKVNKRGKPEIPTVSVRATYPFLSRNLPNILNPGTGKSRYYKHKQIKILGSKKELFY
jgi:hypothetical protein